jgi:hypothetical protein
LSGLLLDELMLGRLLLCELSMSRLLLEDGLQSLKSDEDFRQLSLDVLPARLIGSSGDVSRMCWVGGWRLIREVILSDAHVGCHCQQAGTDETDCDHWNAIFHIHFVCCLLVTP